MKGAPVCLAGKPLMVFLAAIFPLACSVQKKLVITASTKATVVEVKRNGNFTIALEGNPSTGFSWNIATIDSSVVRQRGETRFVPRDSLPGSAGTCYLDFKAVEKGVCPIKLAYFRTFEEGVPPRDSFAIKIKVK